MYLMIPHLEAAGVLLKSPFRRVGQQCSEFQPASVERKKAAHINSYMTPKPHCWVRWRAREPPVLVLET